MTSEDTDTEVRFAPPAKVVLPLYTMRQYAGGSDFHMVDRWYRSHGQGSLPEVLLPPDGFIAQENGEDIAAAWCYFATGIGVCHVEWFVTRPGLSLAQARSAIKTLSDFIALHAKNNNYGVIICHAHPAIARYANDGSFKVAGKGSVTMVRFNN